MADDFDKEAERERLREQLEEEEEDRKATQRMSELLLQGATMTNQHCDECGDPIFRWNGEEFCPTCERTVNEDGELEDPEEGTEAAPSEGKGAQREAAEAGSTDRDPNRSSAGGSEGDLQERVDEATASASAEEEGAEAGAAPRHAAESRRAPSEGSPRPTEAGAAADVEGGLGEARASLIRTLVRASREAEASNDVGRTREFLGAAREAAEALAALNEVRR